MNKRLLLCAGFIFVMFQAANAGFYLTLGDDYCFMGASTALDVKSQVKGVMNGGAGYFWDNGLGVGARYDHFGLEDYEVNSHNARVIAPDISLSLAYMARFDDGRFVWISMANAGYAMARYRRDVEDIKSYTFTPSVTTALYYRVHGQFLAGLEVGYRYLKASDLWGSEPHAECAGCGPNLDLGGMFVGFSLLHLYE